MSDFSNTMKAIFTKSAKFVGSTTRKLISETKYKTNELSNQSKRRDLIHELGNMVFDLCQQGLPLPEEASNLVKQISALDNELAVLRADHAAEKAAAAQLRAAEKASRAVEKANEKAAAVIEKSTAPVYIPAAEEKASSNADEASTLEPMIEVNAQDSENTEVPTLKL